MNLVYCSYADAFTACARGNIAIFMVMDGNDETVKLHHSASTCVCLTVMFAGEVSLIPARITFSMIGKFGISGTFAVVALYTPEIFPTTLRFLPALAI